MMSEAAQRELSKLVRNEKVLYAEIKHSAELAGQTPGIQPLREIAVGGTFRLPGYGRMWEVRARESRGCVYVKTTVDGSYVFRAMYADMRVEPVA